MFLKYMFGLEEVCSRVSRDGGQRSPIMPVNHCDHLPTSAAFNKGCRRPARRAHACHIRAVGSRATKGRVISSNGSLCHEALV